ncbi:MAG TPA: hypothetical protein VLA54_04125, partial [Acidimicrobiia bacterium]|nr:hypothetical protein [Acidimicrobiia bacterium]
MKMEDRLRQQLNDTAEHLLAGEDTLEQVIDLGNRRRRSRLTAAAAGLTAVAIAIVGVIALRPRDPERFSPA